MSVYYHVSTDLLHNGHFSPRVPNFRHQDAEDSSTPRICVGLTIDDCLTAIPGGGGRLSEINMERRGYYKVFRIDTEKVGISNDDIVSSQYLYEKDLVRDACFTNEHWIINKSFTVPKEDSYLIKLLSWEEKVEDVLPHSIYEIGDKKYNGDYITAYEETYNSLAPCSVRLHDLYFLHEWVTEGQEIDFDFELELEAESIMNYAKENLQVQKLIKSRYDVTFQMYVPANLRELFIMHSNIVKNSVLMEETCY